MRYFAEVSSAEKNPTARHIKPIAFKWHFRHDCHFWPQAGYLEQRERKPLMRAICAECLRRAEQE